MTMRRAVDQSYLLRLWADHADAPLRATLVPVDRQNVRHHFANLDELMVFLTAAMRSSSPAESADSSDIGTTHEGGL
jgi:hypothetical protein